MTDLCDDCPPIGYVTDRTRCLPCPRHACKCHYCNDTGMIACRSRDGQYAFPGPVPDDAKGYFDADCWYCDSGRRPEEISPREALR